MTSQRTNDNTSDNNENQDFFSKAGRFIGKSLDNIIQTFGDYLQSNHEDTTPIELQARLNADIQDYLNKPDQKPTESEETPQQPSETRSINTNYSAPETRDTNISPAPAQPPTRTPETTIETGEQGTLFSESTTRAVEPEEQPVTEQNSRTNRSSYHRRRINSSVKVSEDDIKKIAKQIYQATDVELDQAGDFYLAEDLLRAKQLAIKNKDPKFIEQALDIHNLLGQYVRNDVLVEEAKENKGQQRMFDSNSRSIVPISGNHSLKDIIDNLVVEIGDGFLTDYRTSATIRDLNRTIETYDKSGKLLEKVATLKKSKELDELDLAYELLEFDQMKVTNKAQAAEMKLEILEKAFEIYKESMEGKLVDRTKRKLDKADKLISGLESFLDEVPDETYTQDLKKKVEEISKVYEKDQLNLQIKQYVRGRLDDKTEDAEVLGKLQKKSTELGTEFLEEEYTTLFRWGSTPNTDLDWKIKILGIADEINPINYEERPDPENPEQNDFIFNVLEKNNYEHTKTKAEINKELGLAHAEKGDPSKGLTYLDKSRLFVKSLIADHKDDETLKTLDSQLVDETYKMALTTGDEAASDNNKEKAFENYMRAESTFREKAVLDGHIAADADFNEAIKGNNNLEKDYKQLHIKSTTAGREYNLEQATKHIQESNFSQALDSYQSAIGFLMEEAGTRDVTLEQQENGEFKLNDSELNEVYQQIRTQAREGEEQYKQAVGTKPTNELTPEEIKFGIQAYATQRNEQGAITSLEGIPQNIRQARANELMNQGASHLRTDIKKADEFYNRAHEWDPNNNTLNQIIAVIQRVPVAGPDYWSRNA